MTVTIYHNPACETSRNVLALIRNTGEEPTIVEYLKTPPSRNELVDLIRRMDVPVRDLLRQKGTPYDELHLGSPDLTDDQLLDAMRRTPSSSTGPSSCRRMVSHYAGRRRRC